MTSEVGGGEGPRLVPARMLNESVYCPRLFYLEWVQGEWADNYFTEHGRESHRRVDRPTRAVPDAEDPEAIGLKVRQLELASEQLGLIAKIDVVEVGDDPKVVEPIDYKRGKAPDIPERAWPPERVQVCAHALLLREHGFTCERGWLYFVASKERVEVAIDDELVRMTLDALAEARRVARAPLPPPPLVNSPKCEGCSLHGICLPDEINELRHATTREPATPLRRLLAANDDAQPMYVDTQGARIGLKKEQLQVLGTDRKPVGAVALVDISQVSIFGRVQVTTDALRTLCERGIPLCFFSYGGWYYGRTEGIGHKNVDLRVAQFAAAADEARALAIAQRLVAVKILNTRTMLRRNGQGDLAPALRELRRLAHIARRTAPLASLLGIEGLAARTYFGHFASMLRPARTAPGEPGLSFAVDGRNRRPPLDPINALLSFTYALLTKDWTITLAAVGFDPYLGYLHQRRYGRPALALDLMEEFRPLIADSVVLTVVNTGVVGLEDFVTTSFGVALKPHARKAVIAAYESRMSQEIRHPVFGYRLSYRRVLEVQARLFGRYLLGEIPAMPPFVTR